MTTRAKAQQEAMAWTHPVGTPVNVERDTGEVLVTVTRSEPWELNGVAVIMVRGISGCYRLSRVTPQQVAPSDEESEGSPATVDRPEVSP